MPPKRQAPIEPTSSNVVNTNTTPGVGVKPTTNKRQKPNLTISTKADIIKFYEETKAQGYKVTFTSIGERYGISSMAVANIIKAKEAILQHNKDSPGISKERKKVYSRNMQPVEDALFRWFLKQREYGISIDDKTLRGQALAIWTEMRPRFLPGSEPKACSFSAGWCSNFKKNRGIKFRTGHGESGSVDLEAVQDQIDHIKGLLLAFALEDIYNCDETGLYIRAVSNKSLDNKPFRGHRIARAARVSILFCSNSTGKDKRKPLVLSKHKPARLPADILNTIDVDYSGKGYMRSDVFSNWLKALDSDMHEQERHIALLIDSAPCHCGSENLGLTNITIIRLPPNTTSLTQPLDAGIIRSFKAHYSQEMLQVISRMTLRSGAVVRTIQNAKLWPCFFSSWEKVTPGCIRNCFAKVPIIDRVQADELRQLGVDFAQHQIENLQRELIDKYAHLEDTISSQSDIGVLNYIAMINSEGPDEATLEAVRETICTSEFKDMFYQDAEADSDDDDETEHEEDDSDFKLSDNVFSEDDRDPTLLLRSNNAYMRDTSCVSPPSSQDFTDFLESDNFLESLDQLRNNYLALRHGQISNASSIRRLVNAHQTVDAVNDYISLITPQDGLDSSRNLSTNSNSDEEEVEEEEEEALTRTFHTARK